MDTTLQMTHAEVSRTLEKLSKLFLPDCKIGFVMWTPGKPEVSMYVGDEPIEDAAKTLRHLSLK